MEEKATQLSVSQHFLAGGKAQGCLGCAQWNQGYLWGQTDQ